MEDAILIAAAVVLLILSAWAIRRQFHSATNTYWRR